MIATALRATAEYRSPNHGESEKNATEKIAHLYHLTTTVYPTGGRLTTSQRQLPTQSPYDVFLRRHRAHPSMDNCL